MGFHHNKKNQHVYNTSNIAQHFSRRHPGEVPNWDEPFQPDAGGGSNSVGARACVGGTDANSVHSNRSNRSNHLRQSTMLGFSTRLPNSDPRSNRSLSVDAVKESIYRCVNDLGFPNSTVEHPLFRDMLVCVKRNAQVLQTSDLCLSNKAINAMRLDGYNRLMFHTSELVRKIRQDFAARCGKEVPFVTICHDIWNGKKKDILGISTMFIDPRNCVLYRIPIGMVTAQGHTAQQVCDLTWSIMVAFGFHQSDLCASVNDNTNGAILASKYITGMDRGGKCDMHKADLILKHATGLCTRYLDNTLVDTNEPFIELNNTFQKFAKWFMSKKKRSRYEHFAEWCKKMGKNALRFLFPIRPGFRDA
jgi:hypothetical protein